MFDYLVHFNLSDTTETVSIVAPNEAALNSLIKDQYPLWTISKIETRLFLRSQSDLYAELVNEKILTEIPSTHGNCILG